MFWLVTAGVVAALSGIAWWTSGRARPGPDIQRGVDRGGAEGKARSAFNGETGPGPSSP